MSLELAAAMKICEIPLEPECLYGKTSELSMLVLLRSLVCCCVLWMTAAAAEPAAANGKLWQQVYDARVKIYESNIGQLPGDIAVMSQWPPVWPGGGLFIIPEQK